MVPVATGVTIPEVPILATPVLMLLQTPPAAASDSVIVAPIHTEDGPVIVPARGNGLTVISAVA